MTLSTIGFFIVFVERVVEYFFGKSPRLSSYLIYISLLLGELIAFGFNIDILTALGVGVTPAYGWISPLISGVIIGGGSNFLNDIISSLRSFKARNIAEAAATRERVSEYQITQTKKEV